LRLIGRVGADVFSMNQEQREVLCLVALMSRFTLEMSSDDCGGQTDYVEFFTACRSVFMTRDIRNELHGELNDVLRLIEQEYFMEERSLPCIFDLPCV